MQIIVIYRVARRHKTPILVNILDPAVGREQTVVSKERTQINLWYFGSNEIEGAGEGSPVDEVQHRQIILSRLRSGTVLTVRLAEVSLREATLDCVSRHSGELRTPWTYRCLEQQFGNFQFSCLWIIRFSFISKILALSDLRMKI